MWDEGRSARLRADLDGLYGHLYGSTWHEPDCIMETFPIVKRIDETLWAKYRTKLMVSEVHDTLCGASALLDKVLGARE